MTEAVDEILRLTRRFLGGGIGVVEFDESMRAKFSVFPPGVEASTFDVLEDLAIACASFVAEPEHRDDDEIDEVELRCAARRALDLLAREPRDQR